MVKVVVEGEELEVKISGETKLTDILKKVGKNPEDYITVLNGEVVTELEAVKDKDKVKLVRVWSGG